ncbi:hypothetical protein GCM10009099_19520 [Caenispirillum bisanense]
MTAAATALQRCGTVVVLGSDDMAAVWLRLRRDGPTFTAIRPAQASHADSRADGGMIACVLPLRAKLWYQ